MENTIEAFILTYNRKDLIKDSILSLLNQSIGEFKITIMDNGSTDGTEELIREMQKIYPNLNYHYRNGEDGFLGNFRDAVNIAEADYALFFHDDDLLHPDYFKFALKAIKKYPNTAIISTACKNSENPKNENWGKVSKILDYCKDKNTFANYIYTTKIFTFPSVIYKTKNLKECDLSNKRYKQYGKILDKPLVIDAMKDSDGAIIFLCKNLFRYRRHAGQDSAAIGPYIDENIAFNKFFKTFTQNDWYLNLKYDLINYKQLKSIYRWGKDFSLSEKEFFKKAIQEGAGCKLTELCTNHKFGKVFIKFAYILRKILPTKCKRVFL